LQGGASYDTYIGDAEQEGDEELTEFFRRVREEDGDLAAEALMLLAQWTSTAGGSADTALGVAESEGAEPNLSSGSELRDFAASNG
jgi:hypothetical protein